MCVISNFQIKALPEYWNVFWHVLLAGSLGCRLQWNLVLGWVSGVPLGPTLVASGGNKQDRAEGKIKMHHWLDDLNWLHGELEWRWPFRVILTCPVARYLYLHMDGTLHRSFPLKTWCLKTAHLQHFQQLENESLKGGLGSPSPCYATACVTVPDMGD